MVDEAIMEMGRSLCLKERKRVSYGNLTTKCQDRALVVQTYQTEAHCDPQRLMNGSDISSRRNDLGA